MRVAKLELAEHLSSEIVPLLALLEPLNTQMEELDGRISELAKTDEHVGRLMAVPQVGALTAAAFVATLDDAGRFRGAHQVEAYLGLVPRERSSSEVQRRGRITKAGNSRARWLMVETAWRVATHRSRSDTEAPRSWANRIARRRGKRIAMVALARKLSGVALGHGPAQQDAVVLQPEAVVETRGGVLLDAVGVAPGGTGFSRRLGRPGEVALLLVVLEGHPRDSLCRLFTPPGHSSGRAQPDAGQAGRSAVFARRRQLRHEALVSDMPVGLLDEQGND